LALLPQFYPARANRWIGRDIDNAWPMMTARNYLITCLAGSMAPLKCDSIARGNLDSVFGGCIAEDVAAEIDAIEITHRGVVVGICAKAGPLNESREPTIVSMRFFFPPY